MHLRYVSTATGRTVADCFWEATEPTMAILDILMFIGRNDLILRREAHGGKGIPRVMICIINDYNKIPKQIETPKPME